MQLSRDKGKYKTLAYSVATETYRRLEQFLTGDCQKKIKAVGHEELRTIFSILLNFRAHLQQKEAAVMVAFFKVAFDLEPVTVSQEEALSLYVALQELLKNRLATRLAPPVFNQKQEKLRPYIFKETEHNPIYQLQQLWDDRYEQEFLEAYRTHQQFIAIRDIFTQRHPQHKDAWNIKALRSQFYKIMRQALRQAGQLILQQPLGSVPELVRLDDRRIKSILRSAEGQQLRMKVL
jgi:hypothetical protein